MHKTDTKKTDEPFGFVKREMLARRGELTAREFDVYVHYCYHRFADSGLVKKRMTELAATYRVHYSGWTRYHKRLRLKGWLVDEPGGIRPLVGFYEMRQIEKYLACAEKRAELRLRRRRRSGYRGNLPLFDNLPKAGKTPPAPDASKLQNHQFCTDETSVLTFAKLMILQSAYIRNTEPSQEPPKPQESETLSSFEKGGTGEESPVENFPPKKPKKHHAGDKLKKRLRRRADPHFSELCKICYFKQTPAERETLSESERGRLNQTLKKLRQAQFDLSQIPKFETWWKTNWRSGWREGGNYQPAYEPPRPDQFVTFWNVAVQSVPAPAQNVPPHYLTVGRNSNQPDAAGPLDERSRADNLQQLLEMQIAMIDIADFEKWYTPDDWVWLTGELARIASGREMDGTKEVGE